jgi:hypothetical protein
MKGKAWTSAELNRLKIMKLDGLPHTVIAERLGRTVGSVQSQVRYLSLHDMTYTPGRVNHTWSAAEIEQAQEMYDSGVPRKRGRAEVRRVGGGGLYEAETAEKKMSLLLR